MIEIVGHSDSATGQALHFAKGILEGSQIAFYAVDDSLNLNRYVLSGVSVEFHRNYVARMSRFDPLHVRHAADRQFARLSEASRTCSEIDIATYRAFIEECGIKDMVEFFFRRDGRVVAGMSVAWKGSCRVPDAAMDIAAKIHDYLEYNLVGRVSAAEEGASRYGLTARELEVIKLLCCGRTNREIGEALSIGLATVKTHLIHIFEKLGVETRSAVVAMMSRLN